MIVDFFFSNVLFKIIMKNSHSFEPCTGLLEVILKSRVCFLENPARKSMVLKPVIRTEWRPSLIV